MPEQPGTLESMLDLRGKVAVVTGGATGIGYAIAARLAQAGATVTIVDRDGETAAIAVKELVELGYDVDAVTADVAEPSDVARVFEHAARVDHRVDILVNNAGIYPVAPVLEMTVEEFDRVISANLESMFLCCRAAARLMVAGGRGGRIVNITSVDALHPTAVGLAAYDASKHGAWGFTKNLALELAPQRIWVNAIAPGAIATPGAAAALPPHDAAQLPAGRMGQADDVARVALFLASDLASYVTGTQVVVDGGLLLR